jgi:hypothetical protein
VLPASVNSANQEARVKLSGEKVATLATHGFEQCEFDGGRHKQRSAAA